jgi:serine protease AprX
MKKIACSILAAAMVCLASPAKHARTSSDLAGVAQNSSVQVIVQWNSDISSGSAKIRSLGGSVVLEFSSVHAGTYIVPQSALASLDADPDVKFVSLDRKVRRKLALAAAAINAPAVWKSGYTGFGIGVAVVDSGVNTDSNLALSNKNVVYTEDFVNPIVIQSDGKPGPKIASYGLDWFGHGQHIAGIIASNGKDSLCGSCNKTFVGIAPAANIINLKVLDSNGEGSDSAVIAAVDRAIALKSTYNIRVINLSLGRPVYESYKQDPLCQAVESAWQAGITVVVAAGNDGRDNSFGNEGYGTITAPGNDPYVITVGAMKTEGTATRSDDLIASYSSKGPTAVDHVVKPDIVAPGNQIVSLLAQHGTLAMENPQNVVALATFQNPAPNPGAIPNQHALPTDPEQQPAGVSISGGYSHSYYILSGTSMAAAVVSGAVADLLQAAPSLTPDQVKLLLMQTATKSFPTSSSVTDAASGQIYTDYYDIFTVGAGYIDLKAAISAAGNVPKGATAVSPVASYDSSTGDVELSFDPSSIFANKALWGTSSMWGTSSIWGSSVLSGSKALWGTSSIWGASSDSSEKALWGTNAIWSSKSLWGTSTTNASEAITVAGEQ